MNSAVKIELPGLIISSEEREKWKLFYSEKKESASEIWLKDIWSFLESWLNDEETISLKTSGSTGEPKVILVKKSTMIFSAQLTKEYFQFSKNEKWLLCLPASFVGGQMILVRAILNDAEVFAVEPKIDMREINGNYDFASMIPLQAEKYLLEEKKLKIRRVLIGGASIPNALEKLIGLETSTEFYASYGMTETVSHIALRKVNGVNCSEFFSGFKNILLGTDSRDCLTIYNKNYSENVLITNDLVEFDSHGRFKIVGRVDNIINSGGLKIIPEEIEKKISEIIPHRIMIVGITHESIGEKPVLFIEGKDLDKSTLLILKNYLSENLDKNKVPKEIFFLDHFSETANGKLDRKKTKEIYLKNLRTNL